MNVAVTLLAALLLGTGFVLQQHAAQQAPTSFFLRPALIADLLRRRRWLAGLLVMIAGQVASAWSVSHIALSVAEPLLTFNLLFALALAVPLSGQRLRPSELAGAVILGGGVAALSVARSTASPEASFALPSGWLAAAAIAGIAAVLAHAALRRSGQARAILTGAAAGLVYGIADALTRQTVKTMDVHPFGFLLTSWPGYSVIAASLVGLWLMQSAFSAAPLHASLPAISATEPVAGILLGVLVFGDSIRVSPPMIALQAVGLAAIVAGVVLVARAPVLSELRPMAGLATLTHASRHRASPPEKAPNISNPTATTTSSHDPSGV